MRITLPSGTPAEIHRHDNPRMGLVIACDIWGLRPLYDEMVRNLAEKWQMSVAAVEPFPGLDLPADDMAPRAAAIPGLSDDDNLRDLTEAADALGTPVTGLIGYCLGGMYCFKAARSERFARIAAFYGMIVVPEAWRSKSQGEPLGTRRTCSPSSAGRTRTRLPPTSTSCGPPVRRAWCTPRPSTRSPTTRRGRCTDQTTQLMRTRGQRRGCSAHSLDARGAGTHRVRNHLERSSSESRFLMT
ncbi:MAG: hypothetical protein RLZZ93_1407 [Actinomycetota bacterium]